MMNFPVSPNRLNQTEFVVVVFFFCFFLIMHVLCFFETDLLLQILEAA